MANKKINESEDNSIGSMIYQGKSLAQWAKDLNNRFSIEELLNFIKGEIDLGRLQHGLLDEAESDDFNNPVFKDEEFFFKENDNEDALYESNEDMFTVSDLIDELQDATKSPNLDLVLLNVNGNPYYVTAVVPKKNAVLLRARPAGIHEKEKVNEDVEIDSDETMDDFMTVGDLKRVGQSAYKNSDSAWLVDNIAGIVNGKVVDFTKIKYVRPERYPSNGTFFLLDKSEASLVAYEKEKALMLSEKETTNESITPAQWQEAAAWFNANGYPIEDDEARLDRIAPQLDQFLFKVGMSPTHNDKAISGDEGWRIYMSMKNNVNEDRSWYRGGYGGTGKSYHRLGDKAPRGAEIGWYAVEQIDPKAKGKMPGWRMGPSNFPFDDLFFPNRKYKVGTTVMRNKYVNAGPYSGQIYIAIPSYFDIVNSKNPEGIQVLKDLGIPLDLTFGMNPNDDYSMTYTEKK